MNSRMSSQAIQPKVTTNASDPALPFFYEALPLTVQQPPSLHHFSHKENFDLESERE